MRIRSRLLILVALAAAAACLGAPATSLAGCGGVETSHTSRVSNAGLPPMAIGDSTMLLSLPGLAGEGYDANARGCREWPEGLALMSQLKAAGQLPHMVTVALGSDCCLTQDDLNDALGIMGPDRLLVLVTPKQVGGSTAEAQMEQAEAKTHPHRVLILNWLAYSAGHSDWFQPDGLHLTYPGVDAFNALLARALPFAQTICEVQTIQALSRTIARDVTAKRPKRPKRPSARPHPQVPRTHPRAAHARPLVPRQVRAHAAGAGRLITQITPKANVGGQIVVQLHAKGLTAPRPVKVCQTPPGGRTGCQHVTLTPAAASNKVTFAVPRPGGWEIEVTSAPRTVKKLVWVSHPGGRIRLVAAGDSEMQILDDIIASDLGSHGVSVTSVAKQSTGLTNSFLYNWQTEAHSLASSVHPDVSVVFMGANDGYSINGAGCCGSAWASGYAGLVAQMAETLLQGNAGRVYWYLLPTPRPANFQEIFNGVNAGIRAAAARLPGRFGLIDANAFFTPGNKYRDYMTVNGHGFTIHEADGIHLNATADQYAAQLLVSALERDHIIR